MSRWPSRGGCARTPGGPVYCLPGQSLFSCVGSSRWFDPRGGVRMWHYQFQFTSVRCVCPLPVGRATLRLLVRSNGARCADALGFRRVSTSSESTGRLARQPVVSGRLRTKSASNKKSPSNPDRHETADRHETVDLGSRFPSNGTAYIYVVLIYAAQKNALVGFHRPRHHQSTTKPWWCLGPRLPQGFSHQGFTKAWPKAKPRTKPWPSLGVL